MYTREQWSRAFLAAPAIHNLAPTEDIVHVMVAWTTHEYGQGETCTYNLLNTHLGCEDLSNLAPGVRCCPADQGHVRDFDSLVAGAVGNASVLAQNSEYEALRVALATNNIGAFTSGDAQVRAGLCLWGTCPSAGEMAQWPDIGAAHAGDSFEGDATGAPTGGGGTLPLIDALKTCKNQNAGSCKPCNGYPGSCPTDEACMIFNADGSVIPANLGAISGVCVSNSYKQQNEPAGVASPIGGLGLPDWLTHPDWTRLLLGVLGVAMLLAALVLLVLVVAGKIGTTDIGKTLAKGALAA